MLLAIKTRNVIGVISLFVMVIFRAWVNCGIIWPGIGLNFIYWNDFYWDILDS